MGMRMGHTMPGNSTHDLDGLGHGKLWQALEERQLYFRLIDTATRHTETVLGGSACNSETRPGALRHRSASPGATIVNVPARAMCVASSLSACRWASAIALAAAVYPAQNQHQSRHQCDLSRTLCSRDLPANEGAAGHAIQAALLAPLAPHLIMCTLVHARL